jgi:VanZ family protein
LCPARPHCSRKDTKQIIVAKVPRFVSRYLPLIVWLAFISFASSDNFNAGNTSRIIGPLILWLFPNTSPETLAVVHFISRKIAHFTEYAILGFLAARAFRTSTHPVIRARWFLICATLVVVYALLDEYHQSFVPSRTASIYDSMIDMAGGLTALLIVRKRTADSTREHGSV